MRDKKLIGDFGEYFTAMALKAYGFECDLIDAEGIDIASYKDADTAYGISVKTRDSRNKYNNAITLKRKDIEYCYANAVKRGLVPSFAFVVWNDDGLYVTVMTLDELLKREDVADWWHVFNDGKAGQFQAEHLSIDIRPITLVMWSTIGFANAALKTE